MLASDAIAEEQGISVTLNDEDLDADVAAARAACKRDGVGFDEDSYRAEAAEKYRYAAVMAWLQANLKVEVLPWGGSAASAAAAAAVPAPAAAAAAPGSP